MRSVRRTHESGSSEMRHSHPRTRAPPTRPIQYQAMSAASEATPANARMRPRLRRPLPAMPPAASRTGMAGIGTPICSASTEPKTTRYPYRTRTPIAPSMSVTLSVTRMRPEVHFLEATVEGIGEHTDLFAIDPCQRLDPHLGQPLLAASRGGRPG